MNTNIDTIAYASTFSGNLSLWIAIVIGVVASVLVLRSAGRMGGGLFGTVLNLMGIGMALVAFGTIFVALSSSFGLPDNILKLAHTVFFSLGYICMVIGANKLLKGIMN